MGALPVLATLFGKITSLNSVLSVFGLNSSDPVKDQQRIDRINQTFAAAMSGDQTAINCLHDMAQGVSSGPSDPRQCAVGSTVAAKYATSAWAEYQARLTAGAVGTTLIGQSTIPTTIAGTIQRAVTNPVVLIGGAAVLFFLLKKRRRS